jgi:hypothetical protein
LLMFGQVWMFNLHDISEDDSTPVVKWSCLLTSIYCWG